MMSHNRPEVPQGQAGAIPKCLALEHRPASLWAVSLPSLTSGQVQGHPRSLTLLPLTGELLSVR